MLVVKLRTSLTTKQIQQLGECSEKSVPYPMSQKIFFHLTVSCLRYSQPIFFLMTNQVVCNRVVFLKQQDQMTLIFSVCLLKVFYIIQFSQIFLFLTSQPFTILHTHTQRFFSRLFLQIVHLLVGVAGDEKQVLYS